MRRQASLSRAQDRRTAVAPPSGSGASIDLLIRVFFALLVEGDGLGSKAVGHFIRAQGDSKNVLMVPVVILGIRDSKEKCPQMPGKDVGGQTGQGLWEEIRLKKRTRLKLVSGHALRL